MPSSGPQTGRKTQASRQHARQPARQASRQPARQASRQPARQASRQPARQASRQPARQASRQASRPASRQHAPQPARQQQPKSPAGAHVRSLKPKTESRSVGKSVGKSRFDQKQSGGHGGHGGQGNRPVPPKEGRAAAKEGRGRTAPKESRAAAKEGKAPPKEGRGTAFSWRWVRRSTLIFVVSMLTVLFGIAVLQGIVTQTQVQIDTLDDRIEEETEKERVLQQQKTEMSSPARVVEVAKERLGMITAKEIVFLHRPGSQ